MGTTVNWVCNIPNIPNIPNLPNIYQKYTKKNYGYINSQG